MRKDKPLWSRPLADLVGAAIDPVLARQGFSQSDVVLYWEEIVGERLAHACEPICLRWPPRAHQEPATLVIRVESGFALELQHLSGLVTERVNAHLGYACVGRLVLKQGPLLRRCVKNPCQPPRQEAIAAAETAVADIEDAELRQALSRLGARVLDSALDRKL